MNLIQTLGLINQDNYPDLARLLILLKAFGGPEGTSPFNGLTKLAKLDFLLRYPVYLAYALDVRKKDSRKAKVREYERSSVESSMIRFHYGPWDPKHRHLINILVALGFATASEGSTTDIQLTTKGVKFAEELGSRSEFSDIQERAILLEKHFNLTGNNLKNFIYETFPGIVSLRLGEEITYAPR